MINVRFVISNAYDISVIIDTENGLSHHDVSWKCNVMLIVFW